jgi:septum site-determining protein MinD
MEANYPEGGLYMGESIAFLSGKGGTGKTSACAGIASALAKEGKTVLCIDCDIGLRNLDISLGLADEPVLNFLDIAHGYYLLEQLQSHPKFPTLWFLTAPVNILADEINEEAFADMIQKAKERFDYVLMDAPAGVDAGFRLTAAFADRCILVTGASPAAVRNAERTGQLLELMGKTNVRLVVNRVDRKMVSAMALTIDDVMDEAGLPLLGLVPEDRNVTLAAALGTPLLKHKPRCPAALACRRIANRIQGLPEPVGLR